MATERNRPGLDGDDADAATPAAPGPEAEDGDTEGQMLLPDRTNQYLARDRERDIRRHLSDRQLQRSAEQQKRK